MIHCGEQEYERIKGFIKDMKAVPELMSSEKWYDYSREEQQENALMRLRKFYDNYRDKYFTNFTSHYFPWYSINF